MPATEALQETAHTILELTPMSIRDRATWERYEEGVNMVCELTCALHEAMMRLLDGLDDDARFVLNANDFNRSHIEHFADVWERFEGWEARGAQAERNVKVMLFARLVAEHALGIVHFLPKHRSPAIEDTESIRYYTAASLPEPSIN